MYNKQVSKSVTKHLHLTRSSILMRWDERLRGQQQHLHRADDFLVGVAWYEGVQLLLQGDYYVRDVLLGLIIVGFKIYNSFFQISGKNNISQSKKIHNKLSFKRITRIVQILTWLSSPSLSWDLPTAAGWVRAARADAGDSWTGQTVFVGWLARTAWRPAASPRRTAPAGRLRSACPGARGWVWWWAVPVGRCVTEESQVASAGLRNVRATTGLPLRSPPRGMSERRFLANWQKTSWSVIFSAVK